MAERESPVDPNLIEKVRDEAPDVPEIKKTADFHRKGSLGTPYEYVHQGPRGSEDLEPVQSGLPPAGMSEFKTTQVIHNPTEKDFSEAQQAGKEEFIKTEKGHQKFIETAKEQKPASS